MKEIFAKIIESIEKNVMLKDIEIDENKFAELKEKKGVVAFIDGGQAELLRSVSFSLQFIRTACVMFNDNKKVDSVVNEFFVLISAKDERNYIIEIFNVKGEGIKEFEIDSMDETIREGKEQASVSKIGGIVRRFSELKMGERILEKLEKGAVVLDGSLKAMVKGEDKKIEKLIEKGLKKEIVICSLAKTSRNLSKEGVCIVGKLNSVGKEGEWFYELGEEQEYEFGIVKLHRKSDYVFEFDIAKEQKDKAEDVLGLLVLNSKDVVFPGYPYGLVEVDKTARVSEHEKEHLITVFKSNAGKKWNYLKKNFNVLNAHDVLDNI